MKAKWILTLALAGTAWALTDSLSTYAGFDASVQVTGTANGPAYLGFSAYPASKSGKAYHQVRYLSSGTFQQTFSLASSYKGGSYEVALWNKKVERSQCSTSGGCSWCKLNGFHMDGMRKYSSGSISR